MQSIIFLLSAVASLALSAPLDSNVLDTATILAREPRIISLPIERSSSMSALDNHRLRRRGVVSATLDNLETLYFLNASLGTPPQDVRLHLDTGSSDLWVNSPNSALCQSRGSPCSSAGTYSANSSSTYQYIGSYFNISYVDGSGATGDYVTDTFSLVDSSITDFQFGVGYESSSSQGILGIGYALNEVQVGRAHLQSYENLPERLVSSGLISSNAYSLYLNDLDASTGNILFGGIDSSQFESPLSTLPIQSQAGVYSTFLITLTKIQFGSTTVEDDLALAVLLDSGSSLSYLPDDIASDIYNSVGAIYQESEQVALVPCSLGSGNSSSLIFTFSEPTIAVPMDELVIDLVDNRGRRPAFPDGEAACLFGIAPSGSGTSVLGDTFMRSAYVVFDLDNNQISIAQSRFNQTLTALSTSSGTQSSVSPSLMEIGTGTGSVPLATAVKNPVAATQGLVRGGQVSSGIQVAPPLWTMIVAMASMVSLAGMV